MIGLNLQKLNSHQLDCLNDRDALQYHEHLEQFGMVEIFVKVLLLDAFAMYAYCSFFYLQMHVQVLYYTASRPLGTYCV